MNTAVQPLRQPGRGTRLFAWVMVVLCLVAIPNLQALAPMNFAGWMRERIPYTLAMDFHPQRCLPGRVWIVKRGEPANVDRGNLVTFRKPAALEYLREDYVLKMVAGLPGDRLQIVGEDVRINGKTVATGLPLAKFHAQTLDYLQRDEIIPADRFFVIGTAGRSDDSRYWGYVRREHLLGSAVEVF